MVIVYRVVGQTDSSRVEPCIGDGTCRPGLTKRCTQYDGRGRASIFTPVLPITGTHHRYVVTAPKAGRGAQQARVRR